MKREMKGNEENEVNISRVMEVKRKTKREMKKRKRERDKNRDERGDRRR